VFEGVWLECVCFLMRRGVMRADDERIDIKQMRRGGRPQDGAARHVRIYELTTRLYEIHEKFTKWAWSRMAGCHFYRGKRLFISKIASDQRYCSEKVSSSFCSRFSDHVEIQQLEHQTSSSLSTASPLTLAADLSVSQSAISSSPLQRHSSD
jgi:hypothetical protein